MSAFPDNIIEHGGWIATIAVTIWGAMLRTALGRHYKSIDKVNERLGNIEQRLSTIEGQLKPRRRR
jgi:hypothetical protein